MDRQTVMIFGVGTLQKSIIERAKAMGLRTVGIDPCADAACRDAVDVFEIVGGQDYEGTIEAMRRNHVTAIVTAATDKPLVMMARVAAATGLPFYSVETAEWSTDKFLMKQRFEAAGIPCARGRLIASPEEAKGLSYPIIVKPRDNSGSRGVIFCKDESELTSAFQEAIGYSHKDSVLVEEYIEGKEYSIEGLHYDGKDEVIQFTEKRTTEFPYNVELGHIQPADISEAYQQKIREIVSLVGKTLHFENCPSHTELKINSRGIFVIETSPRLGGDYITSTLTPLSTGVNMEDAVLQIALGKQITIQPRHLQYVGVRFFSFKAGSTVNREPDILAVKGWPNVVDFAFRYKIGEKINMITSSLNRYGHIILQAESKISMETEFERYEKAIMDMCQIK